MAFVQIYGPPKGKARPRCASGHMYTPGETLAAEREIALRFRAQNVGFQPYPDGVPLSVSVVATFQIPKSASRKDAVRMLSGFLRPTRKPDADNILKLVMDALNGVAYEDDAQVVEVSCEKRYGLAPMTHIAIREVEVSDGTQDHVKG